MPANYYRKTCFTPFLSAKYFTPNNKTINFIFPHIVRLKGLSVKTIDKYNNINIILGFRENIVTLLIYYLYITYTLLIHYLYITYTT